MKFLILYFWFLRLFCPGSHSHTHHCWKTFLLFLGNIYLYILETLFSYHRLLVANGESCCFSLSAVTAFLSDGCSFHFLLKQHTVQKCGTVTKEPACCFRPWSWGPAGPVGLQQHTEGFWGPGCQDSLLKGLGGSFRGKAGSTGKHEVHIGICVFYRKWPSCLYCPWRCPGMSVPLLFLR